jgi:tetratricopeptide (TPR) repeat protein
MLSNPLANAAGLGRLSPLLWIRYVLWAVLSFVSAWFRSRRVAYLLLGLPAVACAMVVISASARTGEVMPPNVRRQYLASTIEAIDAIPSAADDEQRNRLLKEAEFYLQRLEEGGDASEERLWQRTRVDAIQGRSQRRWDDLHAILSDHEQLRDADAHLAIAEGLLIEEWASSDLQRDVETHLRSVIRISQDPRQTIKARRALVQVYLLYNRLEDARDLLMDLDDFLSPAERLQLAAICQSLGDDREFESQARQAKEHYLNVVEGGSQDAADWQHLAEAHFLLGEYEQSVEVLRGAMPLAEDELAFRRMLARAYVLWSRSLPASELPRQLELLELAVEAFPSDEYVLAALSALMMNTEGEESHEARDRLLEAVVSGSAPVMVHTLIGTKAAVEGDVELAKFHLNQALQQGQVTPVVLNNLAYILAFGPEHDYDAALLLIDQALTMDSNSKIHDTRGQILARMERWPEAIASLETALRGLPDFAPIHQTLAEAYTAVGRPELARLHQQRLSELGGPVTLDFESAPVPDAEPVEAPAAEGEPEGDPTPDP